MPRDKRQCCADADQNDAEAATAAGGEAAELGVADEGLGNAAQRFVKSMETAFPGQTSLGAQRAQARLPGADVAAGGVNSMQMELGQLEVYTCISYLDKC